MAGAGEEERANIRKTWARNVMEYAEEDETVEFATERQPSPTWRLIW